MTTTRLRCTNRSAPDPLLPFASATYCPLGRDDVESPDAVGAAPVDGSDARSVGCR